MNPMNAMGAASTYKRIESPGGALYHVVECGVWEDNHAWWVFYTDKGWRILESVQKFYMADDLYNTEKSLKWDLKGYQVVE